MKVIFGECTCAVMKTKNQKILRKDSEHLANRDNYSSLLQKFKCYPCFVKLIRTGMAPKKNIAQKSAMISNTVTRAGRITQRRTTIGSHGPVEKLISKFPAKKVTQRRSSTAEESENCRMKLRSMQIMTGNYFTAILTCDICETNSPIEIVIEKELCWIGAFEGGYT